MFEGSFVAIITPFRDGQVDEAAFRNLIERQIGSGTHGIVPCGTTGEAATLSHAEHERVVLIAVEQVNKRVPVLAGTGSNSTDEAISLTKHAKRSGADGALLITPYYNKPTQEGLYRHFAAIAKAVDFPLVPYNVPGRTSVNMLPSTVARLAEIETIVALKEATASLTQISDIIAQCEDRLTVLSGDDFTILPTLAVGGKGVISVTANVAPQDIAGMINAFNAGDLARARELHYKALPLNEAMFLETNPIPVKTAAALMGLCREEFRLPLCPMSPPNRERLQMVMKQYGLLS
ncbi:MAG: 4-hydroxy-tetrahydrodipicolinate synthase [Candidatus Tectomicrobia bacterium]|nr:4-hydroxy-tetrahydrodipicolinate synthase [Candidatus Tectomicrobia bacterium]